MMCIKEFVSEVLIGIFDGAAEADITIKKLGGRINPTLRDAVKGAAIGDERGDMVCKAEFDIAVSVANDKSVGAKVGVVAGFFGAGSVGSAGENSSIVSRVKFTVPYSLPQTVDSERNNFNFSKTVETDNDKFLGGY